MIPECLKTHQPDLDRLEALLQDPRYRNRLRMGTFAAASNVTGIVADVNAIATCLHRNGALAFFDYATAAPYVKMDMNPPPDPPLYESTSMIAKDAIFYSPHKMLGGVGSPGVLVVKKELVSHFNAPRRSGGGTVFYVSHESHRFLSNRIERYEGGTPNVPGILRAGLSSLAKRQVEELYSRARREELKLTQQQRHQGATESSVIQPLPPTLEDCEYQAYEAVASYLAEHAPNLVLLGRHAHRKIEGLLDQPPPPKKLPIFSFLIRWGKRFLHYNYVCAVLNDVFGIQSRGGCQCSGPYSQHLLGLTVRNHKGVDVSNDSNRDVEQALMEFKERAELLRPGYTRLSLPFKGLVEDEVEYVKKALAWVSHHAWELICQYRCNHRTGEVRSAESTRLDSSTWAIENYLSC
jgi:selenocysteine lyase/cysteine desulfurase